MTQKANHAESQLQTAVDLNSEYQVKLHKDDITTVRRQAELNQWERKCESQSKEISRLVDQVRVLMSANENAEREIRILEAKVRNTVYYLYYSVYQYTRHSLVYVRLWV